MVLIPEELYAKLLAQSGNSSKAAHQEPKMAKKSKRRRPTHHKAPLAFGEGVEDQAIAETQQRIGKIEADKGMHDDAKQINLQQEFKRLMNMQKSRATRPVEVKMWKEPVSVAPVKDGEDKSAVSLSDEERHIANELIAYMEQNREQLGINAQNQLLQLGKTLPIRNSNVRQSVEWEVCRGWKPVTKPPGHATFIQRAKADKFLRQHLQLGAGRRAATAAAFKRINKAHKMKAPTTLFRPRLW